MSDIGISESMHRLVKHAVDNGSATSFAEADAIFRGYKLGLRISPAEATDPLHQAALLTAIALARRVCLGGVEVSGLLDVPLHLPMFNATTLGEAVVRLGGKPAECLENVPLVSIGGEPGEKSDQFHIRAVFSGWRGGIVPGHAAIAVEKGCNMPLAAMLSAALAVNEVYQHLGQSIPAAGRRSVGLSLWNPGTTDWMVREEDEPDLRFLPSHLWLIGLGHLGQAYLWALGLLPYKHPAELHLVLQDVDRFTSSSDSTCMLSDFAQVGRMKTRELTTWAEQRGFSVSIQERMFDASFRRRPDEPPVALCGIDNAEGRRALDQVGFDLVVEAGLGRSHRDFRCIRLHTLPGPRPAQELWPAGGRPAETAPDRAAYRSLLERGELDQCGVALLAGKAVGAPFVGATAACLVISEVLRLLHDGRVHDVIELDLLSVDYRSAVVGRRDNVRNPGFVAA